MVTTLITVGIACLLAAIIGGGFKGLGIEIPVLRSGKRQIMLALSGVALLGSAAAAHYFTTRPDPETELTLGLESYDEGKFVDALPHLAIAARRGNQEAEYHFGEMLWHGEGCVPNPKEGIRWIRKAADSGYAPAQASLATAYYQGGHGIEKDLSQARIWADRSAAQDDPIGLWLVANLETDATKAFAAMRQSASRGYAPAQYGLAMRLLERTVSGGGHSIADIDDARSWLEKAATQGVADAQVLLASISFGVAVTMESADSNKEWVIEYAYAWVDRALRRRQNLFPLSDQSRKQGAELEKLIEDRLPRDAKLRVLNSNRSWQPTLALPYRHGHS